MGQNNRLIIKAFSWLVGLLIPVFCPPPVLALDPGRLISQYIHRTFTTDEGLVQNSVISIVQTRDGYMWFGTQEGLSRYNGYRFTNFQRKYTPGFISDYINDLYEDRQGVLWIASRGGLIRELSGQFFPMTQNEGLPSDIVLSLTEDSSGRLWVGTDRGLCSILNGKVSKENWASALRVNSLFSSEEGNLWAGTDRGLYKRDQKGWTYLRQPESIRDVFVSTMVLDPKRGLTIGTNKGELYQLKRSKQIPFSVPRVTEENPVTSMAIDRDGALWITTFGGGLLRIFNDRMETLTTAGGVPNNFINRVYEDREGSLWFGTHKGIFLLQNSRFTVWTKVEGLAYDFLSVVREDREGNLLVGTYAEGLDRIHLGSPKAVFHYHDLPARKISALLLDRRERLWVGTRGEGLFLKQKQNWQKFTTHDGLSNDTIWAIYQDRRDAIWIGTKKGLNRFDGRQFVNFGIENGLRNENIYVIETDLKDGLWIGTAGGGLHHWIENSPSTFTSMPGLTDDVILALLQGNDGILWVGTSFGLNRIDGSDVTSYTEDIGLADNVVFSLLDDGRGYLWMSSNRGISRVSREELERFHRKTSSWVSCDQYGVDDGMKNVECNGGFQPSAWRTSGNLLCFPTVEGLVLIDPVRVDDMYDPPPVCIESIVVDGETAEFQSGLSFGPGVDRVEFHYAALTYRNPRKIHFRFRLENYDRNWEVVSGIRDRMVIYRYLRPGHYRFEIQSSLDRYRWSSTPTQFSFEVLPFFWQTGWFKFAMIISFAFLSFFLISNMRKFLRIRAFWKRKTQIGNYRIIRQIGSGGMGTVYLARSINDSRMQVALKVLREEFSTDKIHIKRLEQEAILIDQMDHANIVKIIERGKHDRNIFIAMEYLAGSTLAEMISRKGMLTISNGIHILNQVVQALQMIHRKNIVHRDLKPDNIMIVERPMDLLFVKLLDFGLARAESFTRLTESGIILGTIAYLSPEQIRDSRFSPASDVYSLGVTAYEVFTGKRPFTGETSMEIMTKILNDMAVEPQLLNKQMPQVLNGLIQSMMHKEAAKRPEINEIVKIFASLESTMAQQQTTPIHLVE